VDVFSPPANLETFTTDWAAEDLLDIMQKTKITNYILHYHAKKLDCLLSKKYDFAIWVTKHQFGFFHVFKDDISHLRLLQCQCPDQTCAGQCQFRQFPNKGYSRFNIGKYQIHPNF